jgi:hypothetical protein
MKTGFFETDLNQYRHLQISRSGLADADLFFLTSVVVARPEFRDRMQTLEIGYNGRLNRSPSRFQVRDVFSDSDLVGPRHVETDFGSRTFFGLTVGREDEASDAGSRHLEGSGADSV